MRILLILWREIPQMLLEDISVRVILAGKQGKIKSCVTNKFPLSILWFKTRNVLDFQ